jgi:hypothetical protein
MIYVHRDWSAVPQEIIDALREAAVALDAIQDRDERRDYIRKNADKWAAVRTYLRDMSHGKCWYSEAKECVSRYHVDHFRPHGRAKQAEKEFADGYSWLAFDLDNFRLAGVLCNTVNREHSEESIGKGDWFPLLDPSKRATLTSRSYAAESPVLLDPTDPDEAAGIIFNDNGAPAPDPNLNEKAKERITLSIRYLGLDQSMLNESRRSAWRDCSKKIVKYDRIARKPKGDRTPEEVETMKELAAELIAMTRAESQFSSVARSCLSANRLPRLIVRNELEPLVSEGQ